MKKALLLFIAVYFSFILPSVSATEKENVSKPILRGNIREDVSQPLSRKGIIGLRFIHQHGLPSYIEEVYPDSPASQAGIKANDLIFAIDGIRTDKLNSDAIFELLSGQPGSNVQIFITRGSTMFNVTLTREDLSDFPSEIQNRYLSGPISVPFDMKDLLPYR